eukprot:5734432-Pleurochrysis_carterae.AAC.1
MECSASGLPGSMPSCAPFERGASSPAGASRGTRSSRRNGSDAGVTPSESAPPRGDVSADTAGPSSGTGGGKTVSPYPAISSGGGCPNLIGVRVPSLSIRQSRISSLSKSSRAPSSDEADVTSDAELDEVYGAVAAAAASAAALEVVYAPLLDAPFAVSRE